MKINRKTHLEIRLQNLLFSLLFLVAVGLLAWLSTQYSTQFDWTASHRHTLSETSRKVLDLLKDPVTITAYARENQQVREPIRDLVERYARSKKDLTLQFVNPDTQPEKVRQLGIQVDGEMVVEYQGRSERIQEPGETSLTNALQRLATAEERHVVFLEGHGDRSPQGKANHDLQQFAEELKRKGISVSMANLAVTPIIPDNADVLVIAGPRTHLLPGEIKLIEDYVAKGGNLWWLGDPGDLHGLNPLADQLGVKFLPGTVVDASTQLLGINDPTFALVADYPPHPITQGFQQMTVFPAAAALAPSEKSEFEKEPLLTTLERSWTEIGPIEGKIGFDANQGERQGPLELGFALTRRREAPIKAEADKKQEDTSSKTPNEQRIIVLGDGDFLSNAYLGNGGNLELGINMVQWLSRGDALINIPAKIAPDRNLQLSPLASGAIAVGFLFLLPILLIGIGAWIWFKRRSR
jgi:ABC-type uncharacterized transport system involved in gliding motility auxiliary subunit